MISPAGRYSQFQGVSISGLSRIWGIGSEAIDGAKTGIAAASGRLPESCSP